MAVENALVAFSKVRWARSLRPRHRQRPQAAPPFADRAAARARPAWRKRSRMAEKLIAREHSGRTPLTPRQVTAAIRMFVSTMGWHLLTEQCGLSTDEAAAAGAWATRTLLDAAIAKRNGAPSSPRSRGGANTTRRRRG